MMRSHPSTHGFATAFVLMVLLVILTAEGSAQWTSLGPYGGSIDALAIDPANPSTLYLGVGGKGLYKSVDGGVSWTFLRTYFAPNKADFIVVDPHDPSRIFVGDGNAHEYSRSDDGGWTWTRQTALPGCDRLYFDPRVPRTIYNFVGWKLTKSTDDGLTWTDFYQHPQSYWIKTMAVDPADSSIVYVLVNTEIVQTTDGGSSWRNLQTGLDADSLKYAVVIDPFQSATVYLGTSKGIFRSQDRGEHWTLLGFPGQIVSTLIWGPPASSTLYASAGNRYFRSPDRGATWEALVTPEGSLEPDRGASSVLFIYGGRGLWKSLDGGLHWSESLRGIGFSIHGVAVNPGPESRVFAWGNDYLFSSSDRAQNWEKRSWDGFHKLIFNPSSPRTLYGMDSNKTWKSIDGGIAWQEICLHGGGFSLLLDAAIDPNQPAVLYRSYFQWGLRPGGSVVAGLEMTTDGGLRWNGILTDYYLPALAVNPEESSVLAGGLKKDIGGSYTICVLMKSTDQGQSWTSLTPPSSTQAIRVLTIDPLKTSTIYAGTDQEGVFKSFDGGATWRTLNNGLTDLNILGLLVDPINPARVFAGTKAGGVFFGGNGGASWVAMNQGLKTLQINGLAVDPQNPSRVYAATPDGIFSSEVTGGWLSVNRNPLVFRTILNGNWTAAPQIVTLSDANSGPLNWTAVPDSTWIKIAPQAGHENDKLTVTAEAADLGPGTYTGKIYISDPAALNSPLALDVTWNIYAPGETQAPFGFIDTPIDGTTGVTGAIPVTGWALDDIGVQNVGIYRDPVGDEPGGVNGLVYVGEAVFVEGARPDVERAYPGYPLNDRAGWGYMLLTNFLPSQGNGSTTLHALAIDVEGHQVSLGTKTITCDNAQAVKPFGTIDTPTQGGTAGGTKFTNFGWALTPKPKFILQDGSTITVWVDGLPLGHPIYNNFRVDIATLFPGYANADGAVGYFHLDTTAFSEGMHTLAWSVQDSDGAVDGIGSRYFWIRNTDEGSPNLEGMNPPRVAAAFSRSSLVNEKGDLTSVPGNESSPLDVKTGYDIFRPAERIFPPKNGLIRLQIKELERIAIHLKTGGTIEASEEIIAQAEIRMSQTRELLSPKRISMAGTSAVESSPLLRHYRSPDSSGSPAKYSAYLLVGNELRPLPVGSSFDSAQGVLFWQPGPGFIGPYDFVIISNDADRGPCRRIIRIEVLPKT